MDTCQIFVLRPATKPARNEETLPALNAMTSDGVMHLPRESNGAKIYDLRTRAALHRSDLAKEGGLQTSPLGIDGRC
ncbi:hypothetical protein [Noviherbaspirillum galbum]|uniref:Uncharacterized protein n=1 Tax=Noviherbaspirillum galbum TaxID=2709383 RepID=A0A6B3STK4_9BURK|nr:hypothetical protein [Noviherbaspirillum galbum]NEX64103.1 hypothetical protein [Noviherbaspirillum galbum]